MTGIRATPLTAVIGAQLEGVDVTSATDEQIAELKQAVERYLVIFLRDQDLSGEQQLKLASRFGTVSTFPLRRLAGGSGPSVSVIEDSADSPPDADGWHTDVTWIEEPPSMAFLNARTIPAVGGDTMWVSLYAVHDLLSDPMQRLCERLSVYHWFGERFAAAVARTGGEQLAERLRAEYPHPGVIHPLVRTHPVTRRDALFVSGFMHQVVDMHPEESQLLLGYLSSLLSVPTVQCRWHWAPNDLAIWDERATNHRALGDHYPAHRVMRRCTIDGERPYFDATADRSGEGRTVGVSPG